ncbi:hypothetical protein Emtol_1081 [Emticicia oligotrophica DSM 17448]|uniref:Uncharacterized protein n=1 Tax=Emticicia oligotrophica (strain DSM 17448 / CIP 109782 / MTCC 6937 / GPTSA100-15) TaxID=929562 RepID=A0ABM5MYM4_EMTOG|nr:hypothetical protein [Emticicia oligotrophica]AFK02231.1 hypothetical protein Emtol_1081 [Emticicia oligotrophica DSM 17448]
MIFVFKTSVKTKKQIKAIKPSLNQLLLPNAKWNFDLEDHDKILRIEAEEDIVLRVRHLLSIHNFHCEELD